MSHVRGEAWATDSARGDYSPTVGAGDLCVVSGRPPLDHRSGAL